MSLTTFIEKDKLNPGDQPLQSMPTGLRDVMVAQFHNVRDNFNSNSRDRLMTNERNDNEAIYKEITGQDFPIKYDISTEVAASNDLNFRSDNLFSIQAFNNFNKRRDEEFERLKKENPLKFERLNSIKQMNDNARNKAQQSIQEYSRATKITSSFNRTVGSLLGGIAGVFTDPLNLLSLPFGASVSKGILKTVFIEAGINAGVEVATQPSVAQWQKEIGNKYGFKDIVENVGMAALLGGAFAGIAKGAPIATSSLFAKMAESPKIGSLARSASVYMSRFAHISENNPLFRNSKLDQGRHIKTADVYNISTLTDTPPNIVDLPVTEFEFKSINTKDTRGLSQSEITTLKEIERFQTAGTPIEKIEVPEYKIKTLPQQILNVASQPNIRLRANNFQPEELEMLKKAGIEPNIKGQIKKESLVDEYNRRSRLGELQDIDPTDDSHIVNFRRVINKNSLIPSKEVTIKPVDQQVKDLQYVEEKVVSLDIQEDIAKRNDSPETIKAEENQFDSLLNKDENLKITFEDEKLTLKQLNDEFKEDANLIKAMRDCSTGI